MESIIVKDEPYPDDYASNPWAEINEYHSPHSQSPAHELQSYGWAPSVQQSGHHPEPFHRPIQSMYSSNQPSQPLFTAQWPSMLTNPSAQPQPPMPAPPPPITPVTTFATATPLPPLITHQPTHTSTSRRTLTDQDRRRMCQYHEDNPTVKQTEIGAMFGVERSTVSKVLRQKDKYLYADDGSRSPIKKAKGKFPDIERALANWVRNHQRSGLALNDSIIREKARFFATTVGSSDCHAKVNSNSWLEKFKQKNHLMGAKPRKPSDAQSDLGLDTAPPSGANTPNGISPISPAGGVSSLSPISPMQSRDNLKTESPDSCVDFSGAYKHAHSQSATSLASGYTDVTVPSFSPQSPTSSFFGTDMNSVSSTQVAVAPSIAPTPIHNQPFPVLDTDAALRNGNLKPGTIGTPVEEHRGRTASVSSGMNQPSSMASNAGQSVQGSPAIMAPPRNPLTASSTNSSTVTSPVSTPSQDEARRALELVMNFFQSQPTGLVDPEEYITMGKLMEKLKVQGPMGELPGGMHSIDLGQKEMARKRSIHSL